jgi:hypothetical protein
MNHKSISILVGVAIACGAVTAQAEPLGDNFSVELFAGGNAGVPGSFSDGHKTLDPQPAGSVAYDRVDFKSVYDNRYTGGIELGYAFNDQLTSFARAGYSQFDGRTREVGQSFGDDGRAPVIAQFGDGNMRSLDLGARYTFAPAASLRPFLGVGLGASDLSSTRAMIDNPAGGATRVELAKGGTVFEQRVETGLQYSPAANFDLRLTAAASHLGGQKASDDPNLALLGVAPSHSTVGARWDYPAELGAVYHF